MKKDIKKDGLWAVALLRHRSKRTLQLTAVIACILGGIAWFAPGPWKKIKALGQPPIQLESQTSRTNNQGVFAME